ncbi:MAG: hypothetical protein LBH40_04085 [Alphaproteobacteria bacterium]|jgi:hypothetical protein|nr:hypothetical protein [Alphaproteobacteria bacterium]
MHILKDFILNTLPNEDIKSNIYKKVNNKSSLIVNSSCGIPYSTVAKNILLFLTTTIINQKSKRIYIGKTFNEFMKSCGYKPSGGEHGNMRRFKEQWKRILASSFTIIFDGKEITFRFVQATNEFDGYIEVSDSFYNHLLKNKIYIEDNDIKKLQYGKHGNLVLNVYSWMIYKRYTTNKFTKIKYEDLQNQFGSTGSLSSFKTNLKKAFIVIATILNIRVIFKDDHLNVENLSLLEKVKYLASSLYLFSRKFQKEIKTLIIDSKYRLSIDFMDKNTLILKP